MIRHITIGKNTVANDILMFKRCMIDRQMNLLFGGNGVGKTTFIEYLSKCTNDRAFNKNIQLMDGYKSFTLYSFSNSGNNYRRVGHSTRFGIEVSPDLAIKKLKASQLSEGQSIVYSIEDFLWFLENQLEYKNNSGNVITIDEMDSGLSVDNIEYIMGRLNKIVNERDDVQMFISFNNYAVCEYNQSDILSMYTGKYITLKGYKQFRRYININRDRLLKKRNNNQFIDDFD